VAQQDLRFQAEVVEVGLSRDFTELKRTSPRKVLRLLRIVAQHLLVLARFRPDATYVSLTPAGPGFLKDLLIALPSKLLRRPLMLHLHGRGIPEWLRSRPVVARLYRWFVSGETVIHLAEALAATELAPVCSAAGRVVVVPNGVDPDGAGHRREAREPGPVRLLFLSNLFPFKGLGVLLEASGRLKRAQIPFRLDVVGASVGEGNRFRALAESSGIGREVRFLGPLDGADKWAALHEADIFVHPSLDDAFPLVVIEAMHAGCAVVASDVGGIPEMLASTGVIVPAGSVAALTDALTELIQDPHRREVLGTAARRRATSHFTERAFRDRMAGVLASVSRASARAGGV
jgi:glycosyltransferase involved in cell wall biosynthesis